MDEHGTEAAAATAIAFRPSAAFRAPPAVTMVVDRPFLFVIIHTPTGLPLFAGRSATRGPVRAGGPRPGIVDNIVGHFLGSARASAGGRDAVLAGEPGRRLAAGKLRQAILAGDMAPDTGWSKRSWPECSG